jgi:serine/threonine-protein kinase HipA
VIKVWSDGAEAGLVDRHGRRGSAFTYRDVDPARAVSVTMPVRLASWDQEFGLVPIFEMNLPEGALRERLRLAFAKATGTFDEFDLLAIVGRSQIGRLRYTARDDALDEGVPFQAIDEILKARRSDDLFAHLIEKFATYSGVSGIQPKVLVRDPTASRARLSDSVRQSQSFRGATHIVKLWDPAEYPQLAANEYFCLRAAQHCGLDVPPFQLSDSAAALVVDRFDLRADGSYLGVEDFCVLNARPTSEKYNGSYETAVIKRLGDYVDEPNLLPDYDRLFTLLVLNAVLRNGDAHLKNFAITYEDVNGQARLAPAYDLVTTTVYISADKMALTLDGSTRWPDAKRLRRLAETRLMIEPRRAREIMTHIGDAVAKTRREIQVYRNDHPDFDEIGQAMIEQWESGMQHSLKEA